MVELVELVGMVGLRFERFIKIMKMSGLVKDMRFLRIFGRLRTLGLVGLFGYVGMIGMVGLVGMVGIGSGAMAEMGMYSHEPIPKPFANLTLAKLKALSPKDQHHFCSTSNNDRIPLISKQNYDLYISSVCRKIQKEDDEASERRDDERIKYGEKERKEMNEQSAKLTADINRVKNMVNQVTKEAKLLQSMCSLLYAKKHSTSFSSSNISKQEQEFISVYNNCKEANKQMPSTLAFKKYQINALMLMRSRYTAYETLFNNERYFKGWEGTIDSISMDRSHGGISIRIILPSSNVRLSTVFSSRGYDKSPVTIIQPGNSLYNKIRTYQVGDKVKIWGQLYLASSISYFQVWNSSGLTAFHELTSPWFVTKFTKIQKVS